MLNTLLDIFILNALNIYFLKVAEYKYSHKNFLTTLNKKYSKFSWNKRDVINVELTQYASVHSDFTAIYKAFRGNII